MATRKAAKPAKLTSRTKRREAIQPRSSAYPESIPGAQVYATAQASDQVQVGLQFGDGLSGMFSRYLPAADARKLGLALIAASDHYDAETARLAKVGD